MCRGHRDAWEVGSGMEGIEAGISGRGGGKDGLLVCSTLDWYNVDREGEVLTSRWGLG